jgi:hypothetical protein
MEAIPSTIRNPNMHQAVVTGTRNWVRIGEKGVSS